MEPIRSQIDTRSESFRQNEAAMRAIVADLREQTARARAGGGKAVRQRHVARGKLLPRERVDRLLDPGSPFLEIGQLAAHGMYEGDAPAAGMICGIGRIEGIECMVLANDAT